MEYFTPCATSETGTYIPLTGEHLLTTMDGTSLQFQDKTSTGNNNGLLTVTTHRLIWQSPNRTTSLAAWLAHLNQQTPIIDRSSSSFKLSNVHHRALLKFINNPNTGILIEIDSASDRGRLISTVKKAISRKEWEEFEKEKEREKLKTENEMKLYEQSPIGITGVKQTIQRKNLEQKQIIETSFESLEQLRKQAIDLVTIASSFKYSTMERNNIDNNDGLVEMMKDMGIESPVTKESTGGNINLYREQLSRQLGQFLQLPLSNLGGIMTLTDAYCLINRNRATTELISPQDFRSAIDYFSKLGLPIKIIMLESGVHALELELVDGDEAGKKLRDWAEEKTSLTEIDVMRERRIPVQRARDLLEKAECLGLLARDESDHIVRYFPNLFHSFHVIARNVR